MAMLLKVLIIPDKFKGTLLAGQAAQAIARGWRRVRPHDSLALLPMSDGGDGFGEVISKLESSLQASRIPKPMTPREERCHLLLSAARRAERRPAS